MTVPVWSPQAQVDLDEITTSLASKGPDLVSRFLAGVGGSLEFLAANQR